MKIKDKKKFIKSILTIIGVAIILNFIIINRVASFDELKYKTVSVTKGDTLWDIASSEQKNNTYYKGKDIRDIIASIKSNNNLKSSDLHVEQELKIPTY